MGAVLPARSRNWVFTINNPEFEPAWVPDKMKYLVFQLERGENGTPHYQGYVEMLTSMYGHLVKRHLGQNAHVEIRQGTQDQARDYAMKDESRIEPPKEFGTFIRNARGKENQLDIVTKAIIGGTRLSAIYQDHGSLYVRHHRGLHALEAMVEAGSICRYREVQVNLVWGPPRTGKSSNVMRLCPNAYLKSSQVKWWDQYHGEEVVVIDEFPNTITAKEAKMILGEVAFLCEIKGGSVWSKYKKVFLTSNFEPTDWFPLAREVDKQAVTSRINNIYNSTEPNWLETLQTDHVPENDQENVPPAEANL